MPTIWKLLQPLTLSHPVCVHVQLLQESLGSALFLGTNAQLTGSGFRPTKQDVFEFIKQCGNISSTDPEEVSGSSAQKQWKYTASVLILMSFPSWLTLRQHCGRTTRSGTVGTWAMGPCKCWLAWSRSKQSILEEDWALSAMSQLCWPNTANQGWICD